MKKLILLLVFMCAIAAQNASAQFVTIPDANFRNVLKSRYPTCFNAANQLDTVCAGNAAATLLDVSYRQIVNLEGVRYFKKLTELDCDENQLISLPTLPNGLRYLYCSFNQLTSLPTLPSGLIQVFCNNNQLTSLPTLPSGLVELDCGDNQLTVLPVLPSELVKLDCEYNQLTSLPTLPSGLVELDCSDNPLTELPMLPNGLIALDCQDNSQLSCLPFLPPSLTTFVISYTNITCVPNKPQGIMAWDSTTYSAFPICNPTNSNSEVCSVFPRLAGYVFNDANNNGVKDAGETPRIGIKVHIPAKDFVGYTNENGFYEIVVDSLKTYMASIAQVPAYYTSVNPSQSVTFTAYGETIVRNFPIVSQGLIKDFKVSVNNFTAFARPGFPLHFRIKYENVGTIAGNAQVKFAHAVLHSIILVLLQTRLAAIRLFGISATFPQVLQDISMCMADCRRVQF